MGRPRGPMGQRADNAQMVSYGTPQRSYPAAGRQCAGGETWDEPEDRDLLTSSFRCLNWWTARTQIVDNNTNILLLLLLCPIGIRSQDDQIFFYTILSCAIQTQNKLYSARFYYQPPAAGRDRNWGQAVFSVGRTQLHKDFLWVVTNLRESHAAPGDCFTKKAVGRTGGRVGGRTRESSRRLSQLSYKNHSNPFKIPFFR